MSKDREARVSLAQMKKLLDLLTEGGFLQDGRVVYKDTDKCKFWRQIATRLNCMTINNGAEKNPNKWCKMWSDWKNKTKKKADLLLQRKFENQRPTLTKLELRLLKVINYPVNDVISILNEGKEYNVATTHDEDPIEDEFDDSSVDLESHENKQFEYYDVQEKKEPILTINDSYGQGTDIPESIKLNNQVNVTLEKERLHQKNEELKLKAIELKLKGEELKLKEAEVNKFNYLTNLEEEKLKCMKEIATSLKELVDWTRNNSTRYHNVT